MAHRLRWRNTPREVVEPQPSSSPRRHNPLDRAAASARRACSAAAGVSCTQRVVLLDQRRVQLGLQRLEGRRQAGLGDLPRG